MNPLLSIVLLVRDRPRLTNQCLESLYANTHVPFALTIVDDASQGETQRLLGSWQIRYIRSPIQVIRNDESHGTGAARNRGVEAARTRFGRDGLLYLSDNDALFLPGWDEVLIDAHRMYPTVKIIGGYCHPYMRPNLESSARETVSGYHYRLTTRDAVSGLSWLMTWRTWDEFGPLDANALGVRQSEDWAMSQRIVRDSYFVGSVEPNYVLNCGVRDTFGALSPGWEVASPSREEAAKMGVIVE